MSREKGKAKILTSRIKIWVFFSPGSGKFLAIPRSMTPVIEKIKCNPDTVKERNSKQTLEKFVLLKKHTVDATVDKESI